MSAPVEGQIRIPAGTVPRRPLGKTGVDVSILGLGGYHLGIPSEAEALRIVHAAVDRGLDFMDNCWDYHDGRSEERMGKALQLLPGGRPKVFLMTKLDGRTRESAAGQLEQSLRRLRTDMIDLVQIHEVIRDDDPDRCFAADGAIRALLDARRAGKLRFIGFTGHKHPRIHRKMLDVAGAHAFRFDTVQMPLNALDAHFASFEGEILPRLGADGIGVLGMKPLAAGKAVEDGRLAAPECLRYAMSLPVATTITGCDSMGALEQALAVAIDFQPLSDDERADLLARSRSLAATGERERFKTSGEHDGTAQHPHWLEEARVAT
jgi:aryl-alcohol dehydrogenase-like predicted oxidoreductase